MGRPTKLDDVCAQRIINAVEQGLPRDTAAKLARISPTTLFEWLARGKAGDEGYAEFAQRVKAAEAKGEEEIVGLLRIHARNSWQACAWLLERRHPEAWASKKLDATEPVSPEEGEKLIAEAARLHAIK